MANKSPQKQRWIKSYVHRCREATMFSIPEQSVNNNDGFEMFITHFQKDSCIDKYYPEDITRGTYEYCPYCGKNLIEIEER